LKPAAAGTVLMRSPSGPLPCPRLADRGEALLQELPVDLACRTDRRVIHVDDLIQSWPEQILLPLVARLRHRFFLGNTARLENHDPPRPGIPNHKKSGLKVSISDKIDYRQSRV
jgi:hypothetical protein